MKNPPKLAVWLLKIFCRQDYREEVMGDLQEIYEWRLASGKTGFAQFRYFLDTLSAIRFYRGGRFISLISKAMLFSFVKSSFRSFRRHIAFTFLNVLGLAVSMTAALFILEYVSEELNYNNSLGADQLYRVSNDYYRFGEMIYESSMTFSGVGPAMQQNFPEVEAYARLFGPGIHGDDVVLTNAAQTHRNFKETKLFFSDPFYLEFFDMPITHGTNELARPNTVLLTKEMASKYFGSVEAALGQTLQYHDAREGHALMVTGIFDRPDFNLQVDVDVLVSYATLSQRNEDYFEDDWGRNSFITFIKLDEQAQPGTIEQKMGSLTLVYKPGYAEKDSEGNFLRVNRYFLTPVADIHLNSSYQNEVGPIGDATTIRMLQVIALFIVVIAWINFINLSTAKSVDRAREVGVRKVMGAHRNELVMQFFIEAVLINGLALLLALTLVGLAQPLFNGFVEKQLSLLAIDSYRFGLIASVLFVLGTGLSGLYPALILSSHRAISALKGKAKVDASRFLRRGLIVVQLFFSSLLIIATLAIYSQLTFMDSQSMGFDMEQVLILKGPVMREMGADESVLSIQRFKEEVMNISGVNSVGTSSVIPGQGILRGMAISRVRESEAEMKSIERVVTSNLFLSTIDVTFLAGTDYTAEMSGFTPLVLNVSAARELGFTAPEEAVGETLYEFTREERKIVGVIADYHHESLNRSIDPMYFVRNEAYDPFYVIRLNTKEARDILERIEEKYQAIFPGNPADFQFLDHYFGRQYKKDQVNLKVFGVFAIMAILVACLGLYGLSSFSALQRTKEVGVRKVLGSSLTGLFLLLSKEIFLLLLVGYILAVPLAWFGIESWLTDFAYRMPIQPLLFAIPLAMIVVITLLVISGKILKVATANPVHSLRHE